MRGKAGIIAALWFLMLVNYLDRVAMSFTGPVIMKTLGVSPATFGLIMSSFVIGLFITQVPGGILTDRWGAKPFLVIGPLLWGLFIGVTGLVTTAAGLVIVRALLGMAEGASGASIWKTVGDAFTPRQRPRAVSLFLSAATVGPAVAAPLIGLLLHTRGWHAVFVALTLPSLLAALLVALLVPAGPAAASPDLVGSGEDAAVPIGRMFAQPGLWLLSIAGLAMNIAEWGYLVWMPSYLSLARHIDVKAIGLLGGIPYLAAFVGVLFGGWIGSRWHAHRAQRVISAYLAAGLSFFVAYRSVTLAGSLVGLCGVAFCLFASHAPKGSIALDIAPDRRRGAFMATLNSVSQIGGVIAPAAIGLLVSRTGSFAAGFGMMIAALCLAATCMAALIPLLRQGPQPVLPMPSSGAAAMNHFSAHSSGSTS